LSQDPFVPTGDKTKLVISRHWHHPQITVRITNEKIGIDLDVRDFFKVLLEEIGSPAMLFSKSALEEKMNAAMHRIEERVKEATIHV